VPEYSKREEILPPLTEDEKMWAGLCYPFWFVFSPWTLKFKKKDEVDLFVFFHAIQGLAWGLITSSVTLISLFFIYLVFFRKNVGNLSQAPQVDNMGKMMGCGFVAIIVLFIVIIFLTLVVFITLYYGWKATSGNMFRIPFIGKIAWEKVYEEKKRREDLYYESVGEEPLEPHPGREGMYEPRAPISLEPGVDFIERSPFTEPGVDSRGGVPFTEPGADYREKESFREPSAEVDYEEMLIQNPPVEKLKSIFSQPEEEEQPEIIGEEEVLEEVIVEEPPAEKEKPLSPLEKLAQLRKQQAQEKTEPEPPPEEIPRKETATPVVRKHKKSLSPLEQLKLRRKQEEAFSGILEGEMEVEEPQAPPTMFLDPGKRLHKIESEILKVDADVQEETEEEPAVPPPRRTAFLDARKFPGVMQELREIESISQSREEKRRRIREVPRQKAKTGMSPLEQLSRRQKKKKKQKPAISEEERNLRMKAMLDRMKKKQEEKYYQEEDEDEIF